jgi:hypothetical protein
MVAPKGIRAVCLAARPCTVRVPAARERASPAASFAPATPPIRIEHCLFRRPLTTFGEGARWPEARKHTAIPHPPTRKAFRPAHQPAHPPGSTRRTKRRDQEPTTGENPPGTSTSPRNTVARLLELTALPELKRARAATRRAARGVTDPKREAIPPQPTPRAQKSEKKNPTSSQPRAGVKSTQRKLKEAP